MMKGDDMGTVPSFHDDFQNEKKKEACGEICRSSTASLKGWGQSTLMPTLSRSSIPHWIRFQLISREVRWSMKELTWSERRLEGAGRSWKEL